MDDFSEDVESVEKQLARIRQQSRQSLAAHRRRSSFSLRGKRKSSFGELQSTIPFSSFQDELKKIMVIASR